MTDLLVRLFSLPELSPHRQALAAKGVILRRVHSAETEILVPWVEHHFNPRWAAECRGALYHRPATCFIATQLQSSPAPQDDPYNLPPELLVGFACYDIVARGMFGPEGVHPDHRGQGIGRGLLLTCLHAMAQDGYAYAVIAWAGPVSFYQKTVGATLIEDSEPGIFTGPLLGS